MSSGWLIQLFMGCSKLPRGDVPLTPLRFVPLDRADHYVNHTIHTFAASL